MSAPAFLLANESNHTLLQSLLESMNAIIEHQYSANPNFVYAILRQYKRFEALRNFTLEQGQEELDRENRFRKDRGTDESSPKVSFSMSEMQRPSGRHAQEVPTTPMTPSHFEIGGDSDSEDEDNKPASPSEARKSPPRGEESPQSPSVASPPSSETEVENAVPQQMRGMSEKARGKLPEGSFRRQGSTTSLGSHASVASTPTAGGFGFIPSDAWVRSQIDSSFCPFF